MNGREGEPASGGPRRGELLDTTAAELTEITETAAAAAPELAASAPGTRAAFLDAAADALDAEVKALADLAAEETALPHARLTGEVARTTGQLRMFAEVVRDGSYVEAVIDPADPEASPPRPDVRRMLHPVGPVAVYAASNFPFAFSVAGGDAASALAAGCPVVVKAHPGHPRLSRRVAGLVADALSDAGAPEGALALVEGQEAGERLVVDPRIKAAGFTGSVRGGRALFDRACTERPDPIPFYGELGSINPVVVSRAAALERPEAIAEGLTGSFTLGVGQFCTKPGIVLLPEGSAIAELLAGLVAGARGGRMLTGSIRSGFDTAVEALAAVDGVELLAEGTPVDAGPVAPRVFTTTTATLRRDAELLTTECFGPACLLVHYTGDADLDAALALMPGSLTLTLHGTDADLAGWAAALPAWKERAGRIIWNGWPTGVAVNRAMHHGGPWPATTGSLHTSVGATAVRRFLRPVAYQDLPDALLPEQLRRRNPLGVLRLVSGAPSREPA